MPSVRLVGLSLGGAVGLQAVADHPNLFRSLTAINSAAHFQRHPRRLARGLIRLALVGMGRMDWVGSWVAGCFWNSSIRLSAKVGQPQWMRQASLEAQLALRNSGSTGLLDKHDAGQYGDPSDGLK